MSRCELGSVRAVCGPIVGDDVLERLDLLRDAILEHLEVGGLEPVDDAAVLGRVGVHADEVRADANRLLRMRGQPGQAAQEKNSGSTPHGYRTTRIALITSCGLPPLTTSTSIA